MHNKNNPAKNQTTKKATRGISSSKQVAISLEKMRFLVRICSVKSYLKSFVVPSDEGGLFNKFSV